jgi:hypothetical protein
MERRENMRYSFHGKRRETNEPLDGYIEAASAIDAIDQLADDGIIGVYSVRQVFPRPKNAISLGSDFEHPAGDSAEPTADAVLTQLVAKMQSLVGEVEKMLSRPALPALPMHPARIRVADTQRASRAAAAAEQQENSVLREIFQSNMELRRTAEKLASAGPTAPTGTNSASSHSLTAQERDLALSASTAA